MKEKSSALAVIKPDPLSEPLPPYPICIVYFCNAESCCESAYSIFFLGTLDNWIENLKKNVDGKNNLLWAKTKLIGYVDTM